jgi:hypothetical protein
VDNVKTLRRGIELSLHSQRVRAKEPSVADDHVRREPVICEAWPRQEKLGAADARYGIRCYQCHAVLRSVIALILIGLRYRN